jgi:predicted ATPase/DNA-binding SARP family transcriptional activator
MNTPWRVQLLGAIRASSGDREIARFATTRAAALLARLVLFPNRSHPREELVDLLWPDADIDAGRLNLRVTLASLRRQFEAPGSESGAVLMADRTFIRIKPTAMSCDARDFEAALAAADRAPSPSQRREALGRAMALYGGALLPGLYDDWIVDERTRLEALYEEAQEQLRQMPPSEPQAKQRSAGSDRKVDEHAPDLHLPLHLTRFFGREEEIARLIALLSAADVRLVTIIGSSGIGKSRLALETARRIADRFEGRITFVPLADLSDGALIGSRIAGALKLPLNADEPILAQIAAHLSGARTLLLLDNMEHLGEAAALETRALLAKSPALTCLCTSQRRLNVEGEHEMILPPLPAPSGAESPAELIEFAGVQLFLDRAQALKPDFQVTRANCKSVAEICRRLDGLPLALELAAARINMVSAAQMCLQLNARLDFVTSRRSDLAPRHRSLRAALEWSVQQLTEQQAGFFRQLSVFRGGWQLDSAAAVCQATECLDKLEQLRDRSLILCEEGPAGMRFRMLESLREFCHEQFTDRERQQLSRRHADYFQDVAMRMDGIWNGPRQAEAGEVLEPESDNIRAALAFCRDDPGDEDWDAAEVGVRLAGCLSRFWTVRGMSREGREWLETMIERGGSPYWRSHALRGAGWLSAQMGRFKRADEALSEAVDIGRRIDDREGLGVALRLRASMLIMQDKCDAARPDIDEALTVSRAVGDEYNVAGSLLALAGLEQQIGNGLAARRIFEDALAIYRNIGNKQNAAYCMHNIGTIVLEMGETALAESMQRESLKIAVEIGDVWHEAYCLKCLGDILLLQGDLAAAVSSLEDAIELLERVGDAHQKSNAIASLGDVLQQQGDSERAQELYHEALAMQRELGDPNGIAACWIGLAEIALTAERWNQAVSCLARASVCSDANTVGAPTSRAATACLTSVAAYGPADCEAAWEQAVGAQSGARWLRDAISAIGSKPQKTRK